MMLTDVSLAEWVSLRDSTTTREVQTVVQHRIHRNYLELLAAIFDLKHFHHKGIHALIRTDNTTVLC